MMHRLALATCLLSTILLSSFAATLAATPANPWVVYEGGSGPGEGKHIVLVSGDEEYRTEEEFPQLGKILATHHGFRCTVLFAIDKNYGTINPDQLDNIPGLEALDKADLMIIGTRYRKLPDEQMQHIDDYLNSGRPVLGVRTATHAFKGLTGAWARYNVGAREGWPNGFGKQVLGETWVAHHGAHGKESERGIIVPEMRDHPIVRGIHDGDIWGKTDVYKVNLPLEDDCQPLVLGQVLQGMSPTDEPVEGEKNDPMMPIAWIKTYEIESGHKGRVFTTTMGSGEDLLSEGFRRLLVNASYWCVGLEDKIAEKSNVDLVGDYRPLPFGGHKFKQGVKPSDLK
ncbi:MAG TPA: ThuA domain-containing protein [Pirellulales bacterium]|jgi:hypothetical protein|nr:ThuA domain-containing protein [Pirellulales bacterium]